MSGRTLLIIAHAPSPNTMRLAERCVAAARHPDVAGVTVRWVPPLQAGPADVMAADGIILGTTENLGYMSGALKDFFDRTYYPVLEAKQGLPHALYVRAGLDGTGTCRAVAGITTGLRWKPVREPLVLRGPWQDRFLDEVEDLGLSMAMGLETGII